MSIENIDVRELRRKLGMNQQKFWFRVGVTQSGGSRYESGRNIPRPVQALVRLVHVEGIDLPKVKGEHVLVAQHLKATNPELYKQLRAEARKSKHPARKPLILTEADALADLRGEPRPDAI